MQLSINEWSTINYPFPEIDLVKRAKLKLLSAYSGIDFDF